MHANMHTSHTSHKHIHTSILSTDKGATLDSHDYVFWAGDLNYRIDLPITVVKSNIQRQAWDKLWKQEQLIRQKQLGKVLSTPPPSPHDQ